MNKQGLSAVRRIISAFTYSMAGFKICFKDEQAFRQELLLCLVLLPIPFFVDISNFEKALLILCLFIILIVELLNSAIESVVDRISEEKHELSKKAKDIGSAAVFLALTSSFIVWTLVLI